MSVRNLLRLSSFARECKWIQGKFGFFSKPISSKRRLNSRKSALERIMSLMFVICKYNFPSLVILIGWKPMGARLNSNLIDSGLHFGAKNRFHHSSIRSATAASSADFCLISFMIVSDVVFLGLFIWWTFPARDPRRVAHQFIFDLAMVPGCRAARSTLGYLIERLQRSLLALLILLLNSGCRARKPPRLKTYRPG